MEFRITHTTQYRYGQPAAEAYGEARLFPPELPTQSVLSRDFRIEPATKTSRYVDHHGNTVEFYSLPFRHESLLVSNRLLVRTQAPQRPVSSLELAVGEARQIFSSALTDVFEYLQPS